uniref:Colony stimulating factor 2 receptor subunit beta n=1 Tax=Chelydra serpentina TaxID=8475 RepID=A0A8C3T9F6_CHESE
LSLPQLLVSKPLFSSLWIRCAFLPPAESLPMQSLRCYNDYTSQMTCTWQECTAARRFLQVTLHHEDNIYKPSAHSLSPSTNNRNPCCPFSFPVQPLPPQKLWINITEAGDFLLAWEAAGERQGSHLMYDALEFEVTYKREWESWEVVASASHCLLRRDALVPGSTYVARVRSKPSQGAGWSGQSSEWSTAVSWRSQEGDEAQPKNLRCLFNGVDRLTCSWEVRREVTSSVLFTLFYRTPPASEETECSPVHEEELPGSHYLFHSCEIRVTNPSRLSQYLITVRPKKEEKLIKTYKNIKPLAPVNVTMTKKKEQEYELRWTKQILSYVFIAQRYEFLYWKTGDSLEMLEPSTHYRGKMRARVNTDSYEGPWSEWSEECTWETESGTSHLGYWLGALGEGVSSLLGFQGNWGFIQLIKQRKKWEEKIPNPGRSQLLQSYLQNPYQTLEMATPAPQPTASAGCHSSQGTSQSLSLATHSWRSSATVTASQAPMSCFDFNGPYLHLPHGYSLPDVHQDQEAAPLGTRGRPASLEYVSLPQGAPSQTLLVGEERGEAQLHSISLSVQKEMKQPFAGGQEVPQGRPAGGEMVQGDTEAQRDSAHLSPTQAPPEGMLTASGMLSSNPQLPHTTEGTPSPELGSEKPGVAVPVPAPASAALSGFGSYVMFPKALYGTPEPMNFSPPILSEGVDFAKAEPGQEDNVIMFNPDGTGPVFLRQVGEYCFFPGLKQSEKTPVGERGPLVDQTPEAGQSFGKPQCDGGSVNGKREPALHMQAIQLFKTLKCDDYFVLPPWAGQEPAVRAKELC